jgi:hypothetical protein
MNIALFAERPSIRRAMCEQSMAPNSHESENLRDARTQAYRAIYRALSEEPRVLAELGNWQFSHAQTLQPASAIDPMEITTHDKPRNSEQDSYLTGIRQCWRRHYGGNQ